MYAIRSYYVAQRQRHVVQQLHLVVRDVDQLVVLRVQRADRHEAVDGELVERHQVADRNNFV